ncbi:MAG: hypothetical protein V2I67_20235 [Thermoanaerobaculales bacterium]|nr:hypothetical protein [Thermoanaerobaculales bacterium]
MNSVRMQVLGVFGGSVATPEEEFIAERVGGVAAICGWVTLTGGGRGVMASASRGAVEAGGLTAAILPGAFPGKGYPNKWVHLPIFTGVGNARNNFNVLSSSLCVAIGGGAGTLSEISLALKNGIPVWSWGSWTVLDPRGNAPEGLRVFDDADELIAALEDALA